MPVKKYSQAFYDARPLVLERALNRCEECGAENYTPHPLSGKLVRLQVHHRDGNPQNNALNNLVALCASCHIRVQRNSGKFSRTEKPPVNRAKTGRFDKNEKEEKKEIFPHRETARQSGKDGDKEINDLRVFIAQNKSRLQKAGLYRELDRLVGGLPVRELDDSGKPPVNRAETPTAGFTRIGEAARISGGLPVPQDKEARERRKQEKQRRNAERAAYGAKLDAEAETRREAAEADSEEPPRKRGRPAKSHWQPYYAYYTAPRIRYLTDGTAVNQTGEKLTSEQERRIIDGVW